MNLTLVVPCFNEAARLEPRVWARGLEGRPWLRLLFVDDGSTDGTGSVLDRLVDGGGGAVSAMRLPENRGKAEAVRQGIRAALDRGDTVVGFWDADLATPLEAVDPMRSILSDRPEVGVVLGSRVRLLGRAVERDGLRYWFGRGTAVAAGLVLGLAVHDTQCGAKLFRPGPHGDALFASPFHSRWAFDVEILARWIGACGGADRAARSIVELPLDAWTDVAGSKLRPLDFVKTPIELASIGWTYRRELGTGVMPSRSARAR